MRNVVIAALLHLAPSATVTMDDRLTWSATVATTTAGQIGMNTATGRATFRTGLNRQMFDTTNGIAKAQITQPDSAGLGMLMTLRYPFAAGAGGSADDVIIYDIDAGGPAVSIRILTTRVYVTTAVAASTLQLWSGAGATGTAYSEAFASSATGTFQSTTTIGGSVSTFGSLYIHRSDSGVAGEVVITILRT